MSSNKTINISDLTRIREKTGASVISVKKALEEANGDKEKALRILQEKSLATASKKSGRETRAGIIDIYLHPNRKIGVMIEMLCETDFVAKNEAFRNFAHDIAMHIAASNPRFISKENVDENLKAELRSVFEEEIKDLDKPAELKEKIISGKLESRLNEIALLEQLFVKNQDIKVGDVINEAIAKFGEKIEIKKFVRFEI